MTIWPRLMMAVAVLGWCLAVPLAQASDFTAREVTQSMFKADAAKPVDYSGKDLSFLDLAGLDFKRAILVRTNLYGVDLSASSLVGANLSGARLDRATVVKADFSGANLEGATIMKPSVFSSVSFDHADAPKFNGANLRGARIAARMDGADFRRADLSDAKIGPFDMTVEAGMAPSSFMMGADFSGAILAGAEVRNINFTFARFVGADMRSAKLLALDFSNADLTGADLTGADVTGSNFEGAKLAGAKGLETLAGLQASKNFDKAVR